MLIIEREIFTILTHLEEGHMLVKTRNGRLSMVVEFQLEKKAHVG